MSTTEVRMLMSIHGGVPYTNVEHHKAAMRAITEFSTYVAIDCDRVVTIAR